MIDRAIYRTWHSGHLRNAEGTEPVLTLRRGFGRIKTAVAKKAGLNFKWKGFRSKGGLIVIDSGVSIEQVSRSTRPAPVATTERYYCRTRADLAYARVDDAYNGVFAHEPAITGMSV